MKKITIYGISSCRKKVMELLQQSGCVEFQNIDASNGFSKADVIDKIIGFERYISSSDNALKILDEFIPEKTGFLSPRKSISMDKYSMTADEINAVGNCTFDIINLQKQIHENELAISRYNSTILSVLPWEKHDIAMNFSGLKNVKTVLYNLPFEADYQNIDELLGESAEYIYYEIISKSRDLTCVFILYHSDFSDIAEKALREAGFVQPGFSLSHRTPQNKIESLKEKIAAVEEENEKIRNKIIEYGKKRDEIKLFYDHLILRRDKYAELSKLLVSEETFIISGFVPEKRSFKLKNLLLENAICDVEIENVPDDEESPVLFVNNSFASPVEGITRNYSMPSKIDIDPNGIMAFFYYLFFGMMFSDAGYGLLVVLVTGYISFLSKAERATKNTMKMFFFCGISTTFWGILYGSFFGNAVSSIKPLWIDPVKEPLLLLVFSVALGIVQIVIGLSIKFYMSWRQGDKISAVCDTGSWIIILLGACVFAAGMAGGISTVQTVGIWMAVAGAMTVILMKGRNAKNPVIRIFNGIIGLYDVTSYVSDALSYSRLMALGLSTGVIAQVVNTMSGLGGNSAVGIIMYVVVFVVGHALNFAINMLGAYVHTNRLQYVEFFSKFYEGGGRQFAPLAMNTNYYNFMEDEKV